MQPSSLTSLRKLLVGVVTCAPCLAVLGLAEPAHASTPTDYVTEIITPEGWELRSDRCPSSWRDLPTSYEIVTPSAWQRTARDEPSWGGCMCSELVVPAEWAQITAR